MSAFVMLNEVKYLIGITMWSHQGNSSSQTLRVAASKTSRAGHNPAALLAPRLDHVGQAVELVEDGRELGDALDEQLGHEDRAVGLAGRHLLNFLNVDAGVGHRARDIAPQPDPIPGLDPDMHRVALLRAGLAPGDLDQARAIALV